MPGRFNWELRSISDVQRAESDEERNLSVIGGWHVLSFTFLSFWLVPALGHTIFP